MLNHVAVCATIALIGIGASTTSALALPPGWIWCYPTINDKGKTENQCESVAAGGEVGSVGGGGLCDDDPCGPGRQCIGMGKTFQCRPILPPLSEPKTVFNQAWTSIGSIAYVFVVQYDPLKPDDGHVFMNTFVKGTSSSAWYDLGTPSSSKGPGAVTGPSAIAVEGLIFLTVANQDHTLCLNQGSGPNWTGWVCR